jgi:disulfide bond formation protein DsbB
MKFRNTGEIESMASLLILGGIIPLAIAITAQYWFHLRPCHFCMLQRYPYAIPILCGIASLFVPKMSLSWRFFVALAVFAWLATGLLGIVHTGIEQGWLNYKGGCVAQMGAHNLDALRASIMNAPLVSCKDVLGRFAGLSMASWNSIFAGGIIALTGLQYNFDRKKHG